MDIDLIQKIERVLDLKFYGWQKHYLLDEPMILDMRITGRCTGKTLVFVIKKLFECPEPLNLRIRSEVQANSDWWCCERFPERAKHHPYMDWYRSYVKDIYTKLNDRWIKTREVIFK